MATLTHTLKSLAKASLFFLFLSTSHFGQAQSTGYVTIKAVRIYGTYNAANENEDYRFRFFVNDIQAGTCLATNQVTHHQWIDVNYVIKSNAAFNLSDPITIKAKAWENDCGDNCGYEACDEGVCDEAPGQIRPYSLGVSSISPTFLSSFTLNDIPPGDRSDNLIEMWFCGGAYRVHFLVTYVPPQPLAPTILVNGNPYPKDGIAYNLCNPTSIRLTTGTSLPSIYNSQIQYSWEYHVSGDDMMVYEPNPAYCSGTQCEGVISAEGEVESFDPPPCCNEPPLIQVTQEIWRTISITSKIIHGDSVVFNGRELAVLNSITSNRSFFVRVRVITNSKSSPYIAAVSQINISPEPPAIGSFFSTPDCPNNKTGQIHLLNISGFGNYNYILKSGFNQIEPCSPESDGDCFKGDWGTDTDHILADNGNYTLWLTNTDTFGDCYTTINVPVAAIPLLEIKLSNLTHVSCNGSSTGMIQLNKEGGIAPYQFTLLNVGTNSTGTFSSLPVNEYTATVSDGCGQINTEATRLIRVKQPVKLAEALFNSEGATCVNPGNGEFNSIALKPNGTYDTIVSNTYSFKLMKDGAQHGNIYESQDATWNRSDLPVGINYLLIVTEKGSGECNGYFKSFSISSPAQLNLNISSSKNISCYGNSDGEFSLTASGGSDQFLYKISKTPGDTLSNTTGNFSELNPGSYDIVLENDLTGCRDKMNYSNFITLSQPDTIAIELTKTDITCYGAQNGYISTNVSGGTPSYNYAWESQIGSGWGVIGVSTELTGLNQGVFRLRITDNNSCTNISNAVSILEPTALSTPIANVNDIQCFGQSGTIEIQSTGGTLPYQYLYSQNGGTNFSSLNSGTTNLPVGNYTLKTIDGNGCSFIATEVKTITSPLSALDFSYRQSDYNGFNISCHRGNNGYIVLDGVGGNGGSYSGYQFAIDGSTYQINDSIVNIPTGMHTLSIRDARGCINSKDIFFTEVLEPTAQVNHAQDVSCYGENDGGINLTGTGGSGQFLFKISKIVGDTISNTTGVFDELQVGSYGLVVENDFPGCLDKSNYGGLITVSQPDSLVLNISKNDISCHGLQDGEIISIVSGGTPAYTNRWQKKIGDTAWSDVNSSSSTLIDLTSGTFRLTVTDNHACIKSSEEISIVEPIALSTPNIQINDIQCMGQAGTIEIESSGGLSPYTYSYAVNGETVFSQLVSGITSLSAGNYVLKTIDGNGCTFTVPEVYSITAPPAALNFSYEQSIYNGFNISCLGGGNGSIVLNGSGGNGGNYSGYQYAIDGGALQTNNFFSNIKAGNHTLSVQDNRGCTYSKDILFTENTEELIVEVADTRHVICHDDSSGRIEVKGIGGVKPYRFSINELPSQTSNLFSNLGVGVYTIAIMDFNECSTNVNAEVLNLNPRIQIQPTVSDVRCYDGHDGSILLDVKSGTGPFQFRWDTQTSTTNSLTNIATGSYTVTITDSAGCSLVSTIHVAQPLQPLRVNLTANTVCYGSTGSLEINATGGTSPYQYSLNNGQTYRPNNIIDSISIGSHSVLVKDNNACLQTGKGDVVARNEKADLNFLVSTRQSIVDTLVIKEISLPKPDSIHWVFDPRSIVISNDQWAPQIKFDEPGLYTVSMTGFYQDCGYTIEKVITLKPFEPNETPKHDYRSITSVSVNPNPGNGNFNIQITLAKKSNLSISVYDLLGVIQYADHLDEAREINESIDLRHAAAGIYLMRMVTDTDARDVRLIIQR